MIDVVVPVYNRLSLVSQCIESLRSLYDIGRIIVVDDASTEEDLVEFLDNMARLGVIYLIRHRKNCGYVESVNEGMSVVQTEYAATVNSDVVATQRDALVVMARSLLVSGLSVCGARLLFMPGSTPYRPYTIQHAGVAFDCDGVPYHPFMGLHRNTPAANFRKVLHAVTGAVMLIRMWTWTSLGGLDTDFSPGVYDDVDFCLRCGKVLYEPGSVWLHKMHGSQTKEQDFYVNNDRNLSILFRKWGRLPCDESLFYTVS